MILNSYYRGKNETADMKTGELTVFRLTNTIKETKQKKYCQHWGRLFSYYFDYTRRSVLGDSFFPDSY